MGSYAAKYGLITFICEIPIALIANAVIRSATGEMGDYSYEVGVFLLVFCIVFPFVMAIYGEKYETRRFIEGELDDYSVDGFKPKYLKKEQQQVFLKQKILELKRENKKLPRKTRKKFSQIRELAKDSLKLAMMRDQQSLMEAAQKRQERIKKENKDKADKRMEGIVKHAIATNHYLHMDDNYKTYITDRQGIKLDVMTYTEAEAVENEKRKVIQEAYIASYERRERERMNNK